MKLYHIEILKRSGDSILGMCYVIANNSNEASIAALEEHVKRNNPKTKSFDEFKVNTKELATESFPPNLLIVKEDTSPNA